MNKEDELKIIQAIANKYFDGHFTIMGFTTNYRISFGSQPDSRVLIRNMSDGNTLVEALLKAIKR